MQNFWFQNHEMNKTLRGKVNIVLQAEPDIENNMMVRHIHDLQVELNYVDY